jgi:hypothetical protein
MDEVLMLRIRERAYHIWAAIGGDADQNWLRAEREILNRRIPRKSSTALSGGRRRKQRRLADSTAGRHCAGGGISNDAEPAVDLYATPPRPGL